MSAFYSGAKQGLKSSLELMPGLCLLVIGINMLSASGAVYHISKILDPVFNFLKIPVELLPLIITRPSAPIWKITGTSKTGSQNWNSQRQLKHKIFYSNVWKGYMINV